MSQEAHIKIEGHLMAQGILSRAIEAIRSGGATHEILELSLGKKGEDISRAELRVEAASEGELNPVVEALRALGAEVLAPKEVRTKPSDQDGVVPDDFYSTTNHKTWVFRNGDWRLVRKQRMDAVIVMDGDTPTCTKFRNVKKGDEVIVGHDGIKILPVGDSSEKDNFGFMTGEVSSERQVELIVDQIATDLEAARKEGKKVLVVSGPVAVHTGGIRAFESLLSARWIDGILAGNALAVHDIERALLNTSLGIDARTGNPVPDGHRNHLAAINTIRRAGSIHNAVEQGVLKSGLMYRAVKENVPFVLAGSLRDDGPLPEVITDMNEAQEAYGELLEGAGVVLILSTMLHGIAVGNMIPSNVLTVCVDINPAVATKLVDRGSAQAVGVVTDVGAFLVLLARRLGALTG